MATVHSLVCWGGRTGKSVTASNSSGLIFTSTNHGLRDGTGLVFSGTTAPGNVTFGTTYYAKSLSANTFAIYTEPELTNRVAWSSAGSGVYAKSKKMLDYFDQYAGRWGDVGSERCYDGLASWNTARASALPTDEEVCEIGQAFDDNIANITIGIPCGAARIETKVNGQYTEAYHNGAIGAGYRVYRTSMGNNTTIYVTAQRVTVDGITVQLAAVAGYAPNGLYLGALGKAINVISIGRSDGNGTGLRAEGQFSEFHNCLSIGWEKGFSSASSYVYFSIYNCTAVKNTYGFQTGSTTAIYGKFYNNIFVGNTTNYYAVTGLLASQNNAGVSGDTPYGTNPITMAITDFLDYANNDFRPALSTSPQVDSGVEYYGALAYDIADAERPNYNNGGAEAFDIGCYEYDHGYGDHPATSHISLTNIVSGSRVLITRDDTSAVLYNDVPGASLNLETGYIGNFTVRIRKGSASPVYREFTAGGTTVADQTTSIKVLQQLDE